MGSLAYFLGLHLGMAVLLFFVVAYSRRKDREVTPLKGFAVFGIGWLAGSALVFLFHALLLLSGTNVEGGQWDTGLSFLVILSVTYAAFSWLSEPRTTPLRK